MLPILLPTSLNLSQFSSARFDFEPPGGPLPFFSVEGPLRTLKSVPEPTTLLLFGTTMAGLGLARWRRRRQN